MFNFINKCIAVLLMTGLSCIAYADKLQLTIETAAGEPRGVVIIGLLSDKAPNHVARIKRLTQDGAYNGVVFHRVIPGFMAQTGDVEFGNSTQQFNKADVGKGGSRYEDLKAELSDTPFTAGVVGMARGRYIHSANSQFFIMTDTHPSLNGSYTVIGLVIEGLDIVRQIRAGSQANNGSVSKPDVIAQAEIID